MDSIIYKFEMLDIDHIKRIDIPLVTKYRESAIN